MTVTFRSIGEKISAAWLTRGAGRLVGFGLDLLLDAYTRRLELGHLARLPENGPNGETAPPDALVALGRDDRVIRGRSETDAQYAARLKRSLPDRRKYGTAFSLIRRIAEYMGEDSGVVVKTVDNAGNWYMRDADGVYSSYLEQGNWNWDGQPNAWSRFWVIIHPAGIFTTGPSWGDGSTWGGGKRWGVTMTSDDIESLRAIISDGKPHGTRCVNLIIALDPASFDPEAAPMSAGLPDGAWGGWAKISGGVSVASRLSTARYLPGV